MATLYELTEEYRQLLDWMEDPEMDPQTIQDTLEALGGEIEEKADGYAKVIRQLEADAAALKAEAKRMINKQKTAEENIERLKKSLQRTMEITGREKIDTGLFKVWLQKTPESVVMDEQYIENIPERFLRMRDPEINKQAIKEALIAGEDLDGIAHLESQRKLRFK